MSDDFVIDEWEIVPQKPKRGFWKPVRHPHGSRDVCHFESMAKARRYIRRHFSYPGKIVQIRNVVTHEIWRMVS